MDDEEYSAGPESPKCGLDVSIRVYLQVPQGGVISPTLANIVPDGQETLIQKTLEKNGTHPNTIRMIRIIRYADDLVITIPSNPKQL